METRKSTIMEEIKAIFSDGSKPVHFLWRCEITAQGENIEPHRTLTMDIGRHYSTNYAEDISVELQLTPSQYLDKIYPNRQNLSVTLYQIPLNEDGTENWEMPRIAEVYRGIIKGGKDVKLTPDRQQGTSEDMDMAGPVIVDFQLVSKALEQLRLTIQGGIFRNTTPGKVLRTMFDHASAQIKVDGQEAIVGTDMVAPDNLNIREHVVIPHGRRLIELPRYLQDSQGGIYNADIAFFLQGNMWYIWPKYGTERKEKAKKVLVIFDIPSNQFPGVERTYRETEGQIIVMSTGASSNQDVSEVIDLNQGNGIRFTDAEAILKGMVSIQDGVPVARRGASSSEFVDGDRATGMNFAPVAEERITSNPFKMTSRVAPRKGMSMQFTWENANPFAVFPGMQTIVYTPRDGVLEVRTGVLADAQFQVSPKGRTIKNSQQVCAGVLSVFVSRATDVDKLPDIPT